MRCKQPFRLLSCALLLLTAAAGWSNTRYWAGHYARMGVALCVADCVCFSQQASLLPPLAVPVLLAYACARPAGLHIRHILFRFPSRGAYWRRLCRSAAGQALAAGAAVVAGSALPGLTGARHLPLMNWRAPNSLFARLTGAPLPKNTPFAAILLACTAAACLQLLAALLLYHTAAWRLRALPAFGVVLSVSLLLGSGARHTVWDAVSLQHSRWATPAAPCVLPACWLALCLVLALLGHQLSRKADIL